MMMRWIHRFVVVLLPFVMLFLTLYSLYAQDDDLHARAAALPVLQPEDVFADNVEVIETLPELNVDGINNVHYFLAPDSDEWELLSLPDALPDYDASYLSTERLSNGNFQVSVMPSDMGGPCQSPTPILEFDPMTHLFTLQEAEVYTPDPRLFWNLFYSNPPENIRLRNYCESDLFGAELPDDMSDSIRSNIEDSGRYPAQMNTSDYLIVATPSVNDEDNYLFAIYTVDDDRWSETFPLVLPGDWTFSKVGFENDLLYFVAKGEAGTVFFTLDIASKSFNELFRTPYPQPVFPGRDDVYYYVGYNDTHYQFHRYDLFSQREEIIAELPCSDISGGCTELYVKETNRWTDITNLMFVLQGDETEEGVPYFVVDVTNSKLLYKGLFPSSAMSIRWLDNHEPGLLVGSYQDMEEQCTVMIDLNGENAPEAQITIPYRVGDISPDEQHVVVYEKDAESNTQTFGIVDLETLAYTPVTLSLDMNEFGISIFWRTDETLQATIYARDNDNEWFNPLPLRTWVIRT
jgi:hypothetical protein